MIVADVSGRSLTTLSIEFPSTNAFTLNSKNYKGSDYTVTAKIYDGTTKFLLSSATATITSTTIEGGK